MISSNYKKQFSSVEMLNILLIIFIENMQHNMFSNRKDFKKKGDEWIPILIHMLWEIRSLQKNPNGKFKGDMWWISTYYSNSLIIFFVKLCICTVRNTLYSTNNQDSCANM